MPRISLDVASGVGKRWRRRQETWGRGVFFVGYTVTIQWIFQVPVKDGRDYIAHPKAIYKWYISGIYCELGGYMPPTTL